MDMFLNDIYMVFNLFGFVSIKQQVVFSKLRSSQDFSSQPQGMTMFHHSLFMDPKNTG